MRLFIMRHGQTVWNAKGIIQGWSHNRLSELGKQQVQKQAEKFKNEKIDIILSSPMMRTMQTANIMNNYHHVKIVKHDLLKERNKGILTGRHKNTLTEEEEKIRKGSKENGVESLEEVFYRCVEFYKFLLENYYDKTCLIVTHGDIAKLLPSCKDSLIWNPDKAKEKMIDNAEIIYVEVI